MRVSPCSLRKAGPSLISCCSLLVSEHAQCDKHLVLLHETVSIVVQDWEDVLHGEVGHKLIQVQSIVCIQIPLCEMVVQICTIKTVKNKQPHSAYVKLGYRFTASLVGGSGSEK